MFGQWVRGIRGLALAFAVATAGQASAQTAAEFDKLNAEVMRLYRAGKFSEALPLAKQGLALREKALGPAHPDTAGAANGLGMMYHQLGRFGEAEPLFRRVLEIRETTLGPDHPDVARALNNLASLYEKGQDRYDEAEPLYKRALKIMEKTLGRDHIELFTFVNNLAEIYDVQGRLTEAEQLYKRALAIGEKAYGPEHSNLGLPLYNLAGTYRTLRRFGEAEPLYKRALVVTEKAFGPDHSNVGTVLSGLGQLYQEQGRYTEAELSYKRALAIKEQGSPEHPGVADTLGRLALVAIAQNDLVGAIDYWRRSTTILQHRTNRGLSGSDGGSAKGEAARSDWHFTNLVKTAYRLAGARTDSAQLAGETFETAQWAQASEAASSLAQMAARTAGGSPELGPLVRERQDLVAEWVAKDKLLIAARGEPPARRNAAAETALAARLIAIDVRRNAIDARFVKDFPKFAALTNPKPASMAEVQASLREDEALVLFLDTDARSKPLPEETFIWVVIKHDVRWLRSDLGTAALRREAAALRCGLDATNWYGDGAKRCAELLKLSREKAPQAGAALPFDTARAHGLYKSLLGEAADLIKGKHLLVVPSGALTTVPLQVLVTKPPASPDLTQAAWLIRDHAITVLPSVASLAALRRTGERSAAQKPMIGFADPLLDGRQNDPEFGAYFRDQAAAARAETGCAATPRQRTAALRTVSRSARPVLQVAGIADLTHLKAQAPLPETADEVCEVARAIGADVSEMRIGARATETEVKRLSSRGELAKYRILHFATHGVLAGQLTGTREPGLILTPPKAATPEDDGYLSSSEIASLKIDADWVILSACNTAGGAGQGEAAEALSGLARAFFYAGARALLVSHWEVDSDAAVKLVTGAIGALAKEKGVGRAEALRRATLAAMADTSRPANWTPGWHPAIWAPFVVVGEGGAGR